jgi:hypothetical protein
MGGYIKMDLTGIGWDDVDWIDLVQDWGNWKAFVNAIMTLLVP